MDTLFQADGGAPLLRVPPAMQEDLLRELQETVGTLRQWGGSICPRTPRRAPPPQTLPRTPLPRRACMSWLKI